MKQSKKILICEIIIIVAIALVILGFNVVGTTKVAEEGNRISSKTIEDLDKEGAKIGCLMGITAYDTLLEKFKKAEVLLFNTNDAVYEGVSSGVLTAGTGYYETSEKLSKEYKDMTYIKEPIHITENSFIFPKTEKGKKIQEEFDAFYDKIKENGEWEKMQEKWNSLDTKNYYIDDYKLTKENGIINVVTCGVWEPKSFFYNGDVTGLYVEIVKAFCKEYGYKPNITTADYQAEIAGISSGQYDMMADIVTSTPEREKMAYFSKNIYTDRIILFVHEENNTMVVNKRDAFFSNLKKSFEKTFLIDNRWKMLVDGLTVTIVIAILSAVFGTILGCAICFLRMSNNPFFTALARIYIKTIQGTPIVVSLMILYYLIFGKIGYSAYTVSIIGFSIDFAAYVSEIFRSGIEAVPKGQVKAGYALGFNKIETFTKIVLPQALVHILPVYSGQFIAMVKMTSVAGYISVYDLTKASDFIRTLTYEAFFPLISTAIIYFLLANMLISLLKILEKKIDPKLRKRTLEGVNVKC